MKTNDPLCVELMALAGQYQRVVQSPSVLEPYKEPLLLLRAKYASYEQITEMFNERGVNISLATVRKFCRKHNIEMKRMRQEIDAVKNKEALDFNATDSSSKPSTAQTQTERPPLTTDAGERGPRIARDNL